MGWFDLVARWVVTHGSGFPKMPDLIGEHKLQLPDHLRSWTDAARMCAWEGDRQNALAAASAAAPAGTGTGSSSVPGTTGRKPKHIKHALPQAGLSGMLKLLGCPTEPVVPNRTRRGMNNVESLAQCVVCMVRLGVPMPVTSRTTQMWEGAGGYAGSRHEELRIEQPQVVLAGTAPVVLTGVGGRPAPMVTTAKAAPDPSSGGMGINNNGAEKQGKKKKKKNKKENGGMNNNSNNGLGTNGTYTLPHREGAQLLGGQQQQQQQPQQQQQFVPMDHRGSEPGGPQRQNGAPGGGGKGHSAPHWRQSIPVHHLSPDYLDYFVREKERQYYKSAGILPYR